MKKPSDLRIPFVWKDRHPVLLDRLLYIPHHYHAHEKWEIVPWRELFHNDNPVHIEYCSGNGQWICERAAKHPEINWVAVEKRFDRARKIWLRLHRENLPNLMVICGEAVVFTRHYVPRHSIGEIYVNFPDPWPKLRHAKHRLIRSEFLTELLEVLRAGGKAMFTTDDRPYVDLMLEAVSQFPQWKSLLPAPYFTTEWPDFGSSYFCTLWKGKGRNIHHLQFEVSS